eukprot:TRINITY_DN5923_c0_g1_i2.p1 TRINITY_DN5923_c0_g1~~TRINITY_DN5923_c0_g1_i2.p1  ORF type:complete len:227 (-),score=31.59 TRINITY_DN5923_c0_g1_i2:81-761(-)
MLRITPPRVVYLLGSSILFYLVFKIFASNTTHIHNCDLSHEYLENLDDMVAKVHSVLDKLSLTHALCYESLVGQVRLGRNLPWEESGYFCVLNEEIVKYDENFIGNSFHRAGLSIAYDSAEGRYLVSRRDREGAGLVKLVVFSQEKELQEVMEKTYHRVGWKRRILPANCEFSPSLDCFPARLMEQPLAAAKFGSAGMIPVPNEQFEILKYHFPETWWKDTKPNNC